MDELKLQMVEGTFARALRCHTSLIEYLIEKEVPHKVPPAWRDPNNERPICDTLNEFYMPMLTCRAY